GAGLPMGCAYVDTDGDGLKDTWEANHYIDNDCNGVNDCNLVTGICTNDTPLPGSDPNKPNVYVKWDYMTRAGAYPTSSTVQGQGCDAVGTAHSHQPSGTAMQKVVDAFNAQNVILTYYPTHDAIVEHEVTSLAAAGMVPACAGADAVSL